MTATKRAHNKGAAAVWGSGGSAYDRVSQTVPDALAHVARVCKKGGRLGICTWPPGDTERCGGSTVSSSHLR